MFDESVTKRLCEEVDRLCAEDFTSASADSLRVMLRDVQTCVDALAGVHARAVSVFDATGAYEQDGCARIGVWLRRELRLTTREVRDRARAASALTALEQVRATVDRGGIRPEHVVEFGHGIAKVGAETMAEAQDLLLPLACECDPSVLRDAIDHLHATIDPDVGDREWAEAQEKQDLTCRRIGRGFSIRGFLDSVTGTKLAAVLQAWAAPRPVADGADPDDRPVARRRVEGLDTLLTSYLGSGLPRDKGIRPQLHVSVDFRTLLLAMRGDRTTPTSTPPTLAGYGVIGRDLLARLACDPALTLLLTDASTEHHRCTVEHGAGAHADGEDADGAGVRHRCGCPVTPYVHVLDVGRTERIATPQQRLAVLIAQGNRCATPGCTNVHLEVRHITSWLDGGPTDMHNLVGLCTSCHTLLHRGLIMCTADGHGGASFTRRDGTSIQDIRRRSLAAYAERLRDSVSATLLKQRQARSRARGDPPDNDSQAAA